MARPGDYLESIAALNGRPLKNVPEGADAEREELRRRLRRGRGDAAARVEEPLVYRRDLAPPASAPARPAGRVLALAEAVEGVEIVSAAGARAFERVVPAHAVDAGARGLHALFRAAVERRAIERLLRGPTPRPAPPRGPADVLFLDLETTGLGACQIFLAGVMEWDGDQLVVRQYLARDYSEEPAVLSLLAARLRPGTVLVTFNGRTFDVPCVRMRAAATGVRIPHDPEHLDLLPACRRAWRHRLPNCKLQTLERWVCGRSRAGDIPGAEVPAAYHAFVRSGDAADLARIVEHNARDLLTLAELLARLSAADPAPGGEPD